MNLKNLTIYFLFAFILFELTECVGDEKGKKEDDKGKEVAKTLKPKRRRESSRKSELIGQSSSTGGATEELNIDPLNINQEVQHFINILQQSEYQNARKNNVEKRKFKEENKRIEKELLDRKDESFLFLKKIKNMAKQNTKETKNFFDEKRKELNKLLNEGKNVEEGQPIKKQKRQKEKGISFKEQSSITSKGKEHVSGKGKAKEIPEATIPKYTFDNFKHGENINFTDPSTFDRSTSGHSSVLPHFNYGIPYFDQKMPQQHGMQNIPPTQVQGTRANPHHNSDDDEDTESDENKNGGSGPQLKKEKRSEKKNLFKKLK